MYSGIDEDEDEEGVKVRSCRGSEARCEKNASGGAFNVVIARCRVASKKKQTSMLVDFSKLEQRYSFRARESTEATMAVV